VVRLTPAGTRNGCPWQAASRFRGLIELAFEVVEHQFAVEMHGDEPFSNLISKWFHSPNGLSAAFKSLWCCGYCYSTLAASLFANSAAGPMKKMISPRLTVGGSWLTRCVQGMELLPHARHLSGPTRATKAMPS
jgi:hypothetical protein